MFTRIKDALTPVKTYRRLDPESKEAQKQRRAYERRKLEQNAMVREWNKSHKARKRFHARRWMDEDPERWRAICRINNKRYRDRKKAEREALAT